MYMCLVDHFSALHVIVQAVVLRHTIMAAEAAAEAMHRATDMGDTEAVARMLVQDPRLLSSPKDGYLPITRAASKGRVGIVELLLEWGADLNTTTSFGDTAVHLAASRGHEEVVSLLLNSGADVNRRNASGETALLNASLWGHVAVVRLLLRSMRGRGLNERDTNGLTALYWACFHGLADVVRALLLAGAGHTIVTDHGITLQEMAQNRGHPECTALIQVSTPLATAAQTQAAWCTASIGRNMYSLASRLGINLMYTPSLCGSGGRASWRVPMSSTRPGRYTMTPPRTSKPLQPQYPPI
jgi:hypothetical protein